MWYRIAQSSMELHPLDQKARQHYGITFNPNKAGYVLRDGRMLDYSEGQYGRTLDHRDIENVMDAPEESKGDRYSDYVEPFLNLTGAIRASYMNNEWSVDIQTSPTDAQRDIMVHWHKPGRSFYYDVDPLGIKTLLEKASKDDVKKKIEEIQGMFSNVV